MTKKDAKAHPVPEIILLLFLTDDFSYKTKIYKIKVWKIVEVSKEAERRVVT